MPMRGLLLAFLALLLAAPAASRLARAEEEEEKAVAGLSEDEVRRLRGKLRIRAGEWWRDRKKLVLKCPQCKGTGKVRWRQGRRIALVDCPKCDGHKIRVDDDLYRSCFYEMRTPAFRRQEGIKERLTEEFLKAKSGNPFPKIIHHYKIHEVEIVDATHGIVHVEENKDSVTRPQRWIWAEERGRSDNWFLFEDVVDGPWPSCDDEAPAPPPTEEPPESTPAPAPIPPSVPPTAVQPNPAPAPPPPSPPPDEHPRASMEESRKLVEGWEEERNELEARAIEIRLGLDTVEGHADDVATARKFLAEILGWLEESQEGYDRARKDFEKGIGVRLEDRLHVNTLHFKAHRRLELVVKMLVAILPDLGD